MAEWWGRVVLAHAEVGLVHVCTPGPSCGPVVLTRDDGWARNFFFSWPETVLGWERLWPVDRATTHGLN